MPEINDILISSKVAISTGHDGYPEVPPYSPDTFYPEYPFGADIRVRGINPAYEGVRDALYRLELDAEHYGQKEWNPLGQIVHPGDTVVLKPNFIRHFRETRPGLDDCVITHGAIIRAALDYAYIALKGEGRIIIADAPQCEADFEAMQQIAGLSEIQKFYKRYKAFEVEVYDLRPEKARKVDGVIVGHERLPGDPVGYVKASLGQHSMFNEIRHLCHLLYGSEYDTTELRSHHHDNIHEYMVSKTILEADCVINLPKLKTHKKTGITACMKNLVGINGNKNWLPHYREGTPAQGGDQFADDGMRHRVERRTMNCFRRLFPFLGPLRKIVAKPLKALGKGIFGDTNTNTIRSGNWYGNDTTWRMVIDLNRILMYADNNGCVQDSPARHTFCIVDGIVGGEGDGPLNPTPKPASMVLAGINALSVDLACAHIMGFDFKKLPFLSRSFDAHPLPLVSGEMCDTIILSNDEHLNTGLLGKMDYPLAFLPHFGWKGHIEMEDIA